MCAGNGAKGEDERNERRAGREGVCQQRHSDVPAGQALGHDARANDGSEQHRRADGLGGHLM